MAIATLHRPMSLQVAESVRRVKVGFDAATSVAILALAFMVVNRDSVARGLEGFLSTRISIRNAALVIVFTAFWCLCFGLVGLYRVHARRTVVDTTLRILLASTLGTATLSLFVVASRSGAFGPDVMLWFWVASSASEVLGRHIIGAVGRAIARYVPEVVRVLIIGSGPRALRLRRSLAARADTGCVIVGIVDSRTYADVAGELRPHLMGPLDQLETILSTHPVDQVLIALPVRSCYESIQRAIAVCEKVGIEVKYLADVFEVSKARQSFDDDRDLPGVRLKLVADDYRLAIKRCIDIVGALAGLVVLSPVLLACAVAIALTSRGPIIFGQPRYGFNRRTFRMYKFRTMVHDAERRQASVELLNEARGPIFKIRKDPRLTPIGGLLRRLSLDELPQLINVLEGDMSLVGPRPMSVRDVSRFSEAWLMRRFSVKPGLTGLWQVNGRSNTDFDRWVRFDLDYIDNWSLLLDARILCKTVSVVLNGVGAM